MDSLPSFVDLMDSLCLEQVEKAPTDDHSALPHPSSPRSPIIERKNAHTRSSSSPSLREAATPHYISRYSPYSSAVFPTHRRDCSSPDSSSSDFESSPLSPIFPNPSRRRLRKARNKRLHVSHYGSSSDLAANTPISTYVRRKTPGTSPSSPTFNRDSGYESSSPTNMPFSIPSLPFLLPNSSSSEALPNTSTSDSELENVVQNSPKSGVKRISKSANGNCHTVRRPMGVRISDPTNLAERFMDL